MPGPGPPGQEPVVRSSSPRSLARRSLVRKMAVAASVTSAPVTNKATTMVGASGADGSGDRGPQAAGPADARCPGPGTTASRTPCDPPGERVDRPIAWSDRGQDGEREDRAARPGTAHRRRRPGRTTISWRVWRQTAASSTPDGEDRRRCPGPSRRRAAASRRRRESNCDAEDDDADQRCVMTAPIAPTPMRATPRPRSTTRKSLGLT